MLNKEREIRRDIKKENYKRNKEKLMFEGERERERERERETDTEIYEREREREKERERERERSRSFRENKKMFVLSVVCSLTQDKK
jgi:hypothetical protein